MNKLTVVAMALLLFSCGTGKQKSANNEDQSSDLSRRDQLRYEQYKVKGMDLYNVYCSACHQSTGEGLESLYPPLKESDYLLSDLERAVCIVKNGQTDEITVNGISYNQMMSGLGQLTALEIAEIITYITNEWGNTKGLTDVSQVEKWLKECS